MAKPIRVAVTGASGQVSYALLPRLAAMSRWAEILKPSSRILRNALCRLRSCPWETLTS